MSLIIVLSVGLGSSVLGTRNLALQSAGYIVVSASSIKEAISHFLNGDFDLVLLDNSLPKKDRDRLTCAIRASGSRTAVVSVAPECGGEDSFADATFESDPHTLLMDIRGVLIKAARPSAARMAMPRDEQKVKVASGEKPLVSNAVRTV